MGAAEAASSPTYGGGSVFVPSGPICELVRRRQLAWGLTDEAMLDLLDWHPTVVDVRGAMLRPTAEKLLRQLAEPRRVS